CFLSFLNIFMLEKKYVTYL
ncbi:hypothetical protein ECTW15901_4873, partial [Escherichia coli TW15901]